MANYQLIALGRDEAKQLFGCRTPESLKAFIAQLPAGIACWDMAEEAPALHNSLTGGEEPTAGEYPLNHAVLGGRPLASEPDFTIVVKRPDVVAHVADALAQKADTSLQQQELATFYAAAAQSGSAVILLVTG